MGIGTSRARLTPTRLNSYALQMLAVLRTAAKRSLAVGLRTLAHQGFELRSRALAFTISPVVSVMPLKARISPKAPRSCARPVRSHNNFAMRMVTSTSAQRIHRARLRSPPERSELNSRPGGKYSWQAITADDFSAQSAIFRVMRMLGEGLSKPAVKRRRDRPLQRGCPPDHGETRRNNLDGSRIATLGDRPNSHRPQGRPRGTRRPAHGTRP
jgi:hypothetical protein